MDHEAGWIRLDRLLFTATRPPADYGYVNHVVGLLGERLDALVITGEQTTPAASSKARVITACGDEPGPPRQVRSSTRHEPGFHPAYQDPDCWALHRCG
ncbi:MULTISPECIES: inorganic diphosphatase [Streptomyces]|uniref:inorganic diphosphatase n=1 Tax=Streptomyces TaxID=1883 RepID=UPI003324D335